MSEQRTILCVLSEEQRAEYQTELDGLRRRGIELVFQDNAEEGLEQAGTLDPQLVIVGMELGPMEGLEFLAFFMKRYPTYARTLVVLPCKDDPFPPMAHCRDPSTGRSEADEITFDKIAELASPTAAAAPAVATVTGPSAEPTPVMTRPPPPITDDVSQKRGKGWLIPVIAVVAVAAIGGVAYIALSDNGEQQPPPSEDVAEPKPRTGATPPTEGEEPPAVARSEPDAGAAQASPDTAPAAEPPKEPAEPKAPAIDLTKMTALPYSFGKASARPDLTDEKKLGQLVKALGASTSRIEVGGHTSNEGAERYNHELGWSRAEAVRDLLIKRGVPKARIGLRSYGGKVPTDSNATEEGRRKNRRVTVRLRP